MQCVPEATMHWLPFSVIFRYTQLIINKTNHRTLLTMFTFRSKFNFPPASIRATRVKTPNDFWGGLYLFSCKFASAARGILGETGLLTLFTGILTILLWILQTMRTNCIRNIHLEHRGHCKQFSPQTNRGVFYSLYYFEFAMPNTNNMCRISIQIFLNWYISIHLIPFIAISVLKMNNISQIKSFEKNI